MRKTDKKIDNKLRQALTDVCDFAIQHHHGYQWITHEVNYQRFPESLVITCMFDTQQQAQDAFSEGGLRQVIQQKLAMLSIELKMPNKQIRFQSQ